MAIKCMCFIVVAMFSFRSMFALRTAVPASSCSASSSSLRCLSTMLLPRTSSHRQYHHVLWGSQRDHSSDLDDYKNNDESNKSPPIQWYPGHIAKAERELSDYLKKVDVVIEVRDARIPLSTTHPMVPTWVGNRPLIVAIARIDQISHKALAAWREYYAMNPAHPSRPDVKVYFIDGKLGAGVLTLKKQALKAGISINERRVRRGIQPRAVRAAVIGFPNVGKSALINRLLGRKMAKSRNLPGVTKSLTWVRMGGREVEGLTENSIELLDSPGIIPAKQLEYEAALKLAICNDIGEASYDRVVVAAALCDRLNTLHQQHGQTYVHMRKILDRYGLPYDELTGEQIVYDVAEKFYQGNVVHASDKLLGDFRKGFIGYGSLEAPPVNVNNENNNGQGKKMQVMRTGGIIKETRIRQHLDDNDVDDGDDELEGYIADGTDSDSTTGYGHDVNDLLRPPARTASGLGLVNENDQGDGAVTSEVSETAEKSSLDVGKGNYDGW